MSKEFEDYPKGRLSLQGGELQDCYDVSVELEDGETLVHTLRNRGMANGSTPGKRFGKVDFKSAISEAGFERDYMANWHNRKVVQARFKVPGKTFTITGRFTKPKMTANVDNFVDFSISLSGKYSIATT